MTIIADIPTNVNHELCPPSQCDASDKDIAKSGLDRNLLASKSSMTSLKFTAGKISSRTLESLLL